MQIGVRLDDQTKLYEEIEKLTGWEREQTNDEWRRNCSREEFAGWLADTFDLCGAGCSKCFVKELCFDEHNNKMPGDLILDWLKQQHRG